MNSTSIVTLIKLFRLDYHLLLKLYLSFSLYGCTLTKDRLLGINSAGFLYLYRLRKFIWLLVKVRKLLGKKYPIPNDPTFTPDVMLVVPAYNERDYIENKLRNSLALNYPVANIQLLFVTEGSTDGTTEFLERARQHEPRLHLKGGKDRKGKIEAMNLAMPLVETPITIFTDANTALNPEAIQNIVRHFADPKVGAVSGEKRIVTLANESAAGSGEGFYWKYESFLKKLDTELYSVVGAAGELFAIRTELYQPVEKDTLLDDFIISLRIAERGYRVIYEPEAPRY